MTLTSVLQATPTTELRRALNSQKEYLYFDISVFIKCTNTYKEPSPTTWNGYDFIIENDDTTNFYINEELKSRNN
jgi:hypothetical protein